MPSERELFEKSYVNKSIKKIIDYLNHAKIVYDKDKLNEDLDMAVKEITELRNYTEDMSDNLEGFDI